MQLRGKGTLTVDGGKNRWNGPAIKLKKIPKAIRAQWELAWPTRRCRRRPLRPSRRSAAVTTTTTASGELTARGRERARS